MPWPCNKREPGSGCAAVGGLHERHAILGWTPECVATQPSDPAVALAALDAQVDVLGPAGPRAIPMRGFHLSLAEAGGGEPARDPAGPGELIVGYRIPVVDGAGQAYVKVRERASYEYAIVSAAATAVGVGRGGRERARVALGSVAARPWRLPGAEAALAGTPLTARRCARSSSAGWPTPTHCRATRSR